jgi:hypothetical protein
MDSSKRTPLAAGAFFIACAVAVFCLGYVYNQSVMDAVFSAIIGLFGITILFKTMFRRS